MFDSCIKHLYSCAISFAEKMQVVLKVLLVDRFLKRRSNYLLSNFPFVEAEQGVLHKEKLCWEEGWARRAYL